MGRRIRPVQAAGSRCGGGGTYLGGLYAYTPFTPRQAAPPITTPLQRPTPYIQLVNEDLVTADDKTWTGFYPDLNGYCKCYYTSPHKTG